MGVTLLFLDSNGMREFTVLCHYMHLHVSAFCVMAGKVKLVVAGEAGFISQQSTTPEKPRGTLYHVWNSSRSLAWP